MKRSFLLIGLSSVALGSLVWWLFRHTPKTALDRSAWFALDEKLSPSEEIAIRYALDREPNSENLRAFADSLDPPFPLAASLLRQKAGS